MISVSRVKLITGDKGQILSKIFSTNDINISLRFKHGTLSRKPLKKFVPSTRITGEDMIEENTRRFQKVPKISKPQEEIVHGVPITSDNSKFLKVKRIYRYYNKYILYSSKYTEMSSLGVPEVPWHPQILADQLTLCQPGGRLIMPTK